MLTFVLIFVLTFVLTLCVDLCVDFCVDLAAGVGGEADEQLPGVGGHPSSSGELAAAGVGGHSGGAILAEGGVGETDLRDAGGDRLKCGKSGP